MAVMLERVETRRAELFSLLGPLPEVAGPPPARLVSREEREGYALEKLVLDLNGVEDVPAYLALPSKPAATPIPVVLYNHAWNFDLGKNELLRGGTGAQQRPYVEPLTAAGYAVFCADMWSFGERRGKSESALFKELLWKGQVLWGMRVFDTLRALDYLVERPELDADRIATLGKSMGSTMAWWAAAIDTRISVCVDLCCMTDFQTLIDVDGLDRHAIYYYVPGLVSRFETAEINALIAPRPHLSLAGRYDNLTPEVGLERIDAALRRVYAEAGASDAWKLIVYGAGHIETADMRAEVMAFLGEHL
jgi:dienelactone hydrolase